MSASNSSVSPPARSDQRVHAEKIADALTTLQRRFLVDITAKVTATKISIPQFTLLGFLSTGESLNMGQLATMMGHTTPATTGLVDRLVSTGLVERFNLPSDRRQVLVKITPKGQKIVEDIRSEMCDHVENILTRLSDSDGVAWLRIYEEILTYCEENRDA